MIAAAAVFRPQPVGGKVLASSSTPFAAFGFHRVDLRPRGSKPRMGPADDPPVALLGLHERGRSTRHAPEECERSLESVEHVPHRLAAVVLHPQVYYCRRKKVRRRKARLNPTAEECRLIRLHTY